MTMAATIHRIVLVLVTLAISATASASAADGGLSFFSSMKIRELKAYIARKGTECLACSSKEDLVARAAEIQDWPDVPEEENTKDDKPSEEEVRKVFDNLKTDDEKMAKIKEDLKKSGLDLTNLGGNVYSAEDLKKAFKKEEARKQEL